MKAKFLFSTLLLLLLLPCGVAAQQLPRKVKNVTLTDLEGKPATLPLFGEKNLMIFYVDPDHPKQNESFTDELERNHRAAGDNLYSFGIMNLKDAPLIPNGMACSIAQKRTALNHAIILADKNRILSRSWGLGDCNNQFVLLLISKEGELVYVHKGEISPQEAEAFYKIVDNYR